MTRAEKSERNEQMREYKSHGHTMQEVADMFGVSKMSAQRICKGIAPQRADIKGKPSKYKGVLQDESKVAVFIEQRMPEVEYVGNYTGADGRADIRCKICGTVFNRSMISIRKGHCSCPVCREAELSKAREQRLLAEEAELERRKIERQRKAEEREAEAERKRKARKHSCPVCGEITFRKKYCSPECAKKAENKRRDFSRRMKLSIAKVDNDITVEGLYRRDNGTCYLCGGRCNYEDYTVIDGAFIAGDWYPSIDHVIPLAKGGEHSWNNVMLAHRLCNPRKSDKL